MTINGSLGGTQYTLGLRNVSRRNGNAGPEIVITPGGAILDRRDEVLFVNEDGPRISGSVRRAFGDGSLLNANAAFALFNLDLGEDGFRTGHRASPTGPASCASASANIITSWAATMSSGWAAAG